MGRVVLIGGGARSGKSRAALAYATHLGRKRLFIATAHAGDDEMRDRIAHHQEERGDAFVTREEPLDVVEVLESAGSFEVVVIDCLTLWLSNLLLAELD
ncbi:MAG: bifunctional adenosylcobinamide kinase/adenosylcobinamide-phosphate guanylyltransferase, partial [Polyangiales bacterium]